MEFGMSLNIAAVAVGSTCDGPGRRIVVWVRGCLKNCPGCYNRAFRDPYPVSLASVEGLCRLVDREVERGDCFGITLSGGEPFLQAEGLAVLAGHARSRGLNVITFTGYTLEELLGEGVEGSRLLLGNTDLLIDGPFVAEKAVHEGLRGSSNQRFIYLTGALTPYSSEIEHGRHRMYCYLDGGGWVRFSGFPAPIQVPGPRFTWAGKEAEGSKEG
jgi:anaerobic ribonucleoside-triphosphate reductase activating protein